MGVNDGSGHMEMGYQGGPPPQGYNNQYQGPPPPVGAPPVQGYPQQGYGGYGQPQGAQPIPGLRIVAPIVQPQPGQVITGYELVIPETGCCKVDGLNAGGWITIVILVVIGLPCFAFIPCMMPECFDKAQRPVYGYPQQNIPQGAPPAGYQ